MNPEPTQPPPLVSVVIPVFDEEGSLEILHAELDKAFSAVAGGSEFIFVDDASRDRSLSVLRHLEGKDDRMRVISLARRGGQSAALDAGFRAARGSIIAMLDADLQNDPADLPRLLGHLGRADVVNGIRVERQDPWLRRVSSRIANALRNRITGASVRDVGCSIRVMRAEFVKRVDLYRGMHRFLPTLLAMQGARLVEVPVAHRPRRFGSSKYRIGNRLPEALIDLFAVWRMKRRSHDIPGNEL